MDNPIPFHRRRVASSEEEAMEDILRHSLEEKEKELASLLDTVRYEWARKLRK